MDLYVPLGMPQNTKEMLLSIGNIQLRCSASYSKLNDFETPDFSLSQGLLVRKLTSPSKHC